MCANCVTTAEMYVAQAAFVGAVLHRPAHRLLAAAGLVNPFDPSLHTPWRAGCPEPSQTVPI